MFDLGIQELIVIFVVALIVFGPKRLPELGRTLGKGILELRKAMEGIKEQMHAESDALKPLENHREPEEKKDETGAVSDAAYPPLEGTQDLEKEKEKTDTGTVKDTTDTKAPGAGKEDKVDGR
jgi:sec-independent protein translocase protein TatB